MTPTEELRAKLDELDVRWWPDVYYRDTNTCWRVGDFEWRASEERNGKLLMGCSCVKYLTPKQVIAATVGKDIEHYDGSGRHGTVAILQGGRKPEEVLFVRDEGGVTHYLPEDVGTCRNLSSGGEFTCSECGYNVVEGCEGDFDGFRHCPNCGRRIKDGAE